MKEFINLITHDNAVKYSFISSVVFLMLLTALLIFQYNKFPPIVPLFNSLPWGKSRLVPTQMILIIPIFLTIITGTNVLLFSSLYKKYTILSRMLSVNILLSVVLTFIAFIQIILLVF